jgi:hypothetical protein
MNDFIQLSQDGFARDGLSGTLFESVEEVIREPIADQDLARARDRAGRLDRAKPSRRARAVRFILATAAVAAAFLAVIVIWRGHQPGAAWAHVVEAVAKKAWLHAGSTMANGIKEEVWFSASRAVMGGRVVLAPSTETPGEVLSWDDLNAKTVDRYDPQKRVIVRTRGSDGRKVSDLLRAMFGAFLSAEPGRTIDAGRLKLVHQQQRIVREEGRRCIEHRFRLQDEDAEPADTQWVVYVDPDTQLAFRWDQVSHDPSNPSIVRTRRWDIDYPATGPADIYALGVPKTAKIVDRSLPPDVEQLVTEVLARSRWADKRFYAVVVESRGGRPWWDGSSVLRVWSSGFRWRVDHIVGHVNQPGESAPKDADPAAWWKKKVEALQFRPESRCDGKWEWQYSITSRNPTPADIAAGASGDAMVIESIQKKRGQPVRKDQFRDQYPIGMMGHPTNRYSPPPFGLRLLPGFEAAVDPKPKSGPPGTISLQVSNPDWKPTESQSVFPSPQTWRLWFAPNKGYLLVRWEELVSHEGKEEMTHGSVIEETTRAPDGRWYPTVVRRFNAIRFTRSDKKEDMILRFYYDFEADIPDSLFEP